MTVIDGYPYAHLSVYGPNGSSHWSVVNIDGEPRLMLDSKTADISPPRMVVDGVEIPIYSEEEVEALQESQARWRSGIVTADDLVAEYVRNPSSHHDEKRASDPGRDEGNS